MDKYLQLDYELATNLGWTNIILDDGTAQIISPNLIGVSPNNGGTKQVPFYSRDPYQTTNLINEYELDINWTFDRIGNLLVTVYNSDYDSTITETVKDHINRKKCLCYAVAKVVNLIVLEKKLKNNE